MLQEDILEQLKNEPDEPYEAIEEFVGAANEVKEGLASRINAVTTAVLDDGNLMK